MLVIHHVTNRAYSVIEETRTHDFRLSVPGGRNYMSQLRNNCDIQAQNGKGNKRARGVIYYVLLCSFRLEMNIVTVNTGHKENW